MLVTSNEIYLFQRYCDDNFLVFELETPCLLSATPEILIFKNTSEKLFFLANLNFAYFLFQTPPFLTSSKNLTSYKQKKETKLHNCRTCIKILPIWSYHQVVAALI
jgi:hypothetical protein